MKPSFLGWRFSSIIRLSQQFNFLYESQAFDDRKRTKLYVVSVMLILWCLIEMQTIDNFFILLFILLNCHKFINTYIFVRMIMCLIVSIDYKLIYLKCLANNNIEFPRLRVFCLSLTLFWALNASIKQNANQIQEQ